VQEFDDSDSILKPELYLFETLGPIHSSFYFFPSDNVKTAGSEGETFHWHPFCLMQILKQPGKRREQKKLCRQRRLPPTLMKEKEQLRLGFRKNPL
jgi:hypothetical protein